MVDFPVHVWVPEGRSWEVNSFWNPGGENDRGVPEGFIWIDVLPSISRAVPAPNLSSTNHHASINLNFYRHVLSFDGQNPSLRMVESQTNHQSYSNYLSPINHQPSSSTFTLGMFQELFDIAKLWDSPQPGGISVLAVVSFPGRSWGMSLEKLSQNCNSNKAYRSQMLHGAGTFACIGAIYGVNVGIYSIHGASGDGYSDYFILFPSDHFWYRLWNILKRMQRHCFRSASWNRWHALPRCRSRDWWLHMRCKCTSSAEFRGRTCTAPQLQSVLTWWVFPAKFANCT